MTGLWVFVCGPSGAGKDSVIAWARQALAERGDIVFARRMITRPAQAGSDHEPVEEDDFRFLRASGALAWHWEAHGFAYGVPARYAHQVAWGRVVVVNGSREHVAGLRRDPALRVVQVTAGAADLSQRLRQRERESPAAIASRLARNEQLGKVDADLVIANDRELAAAGAQLARYLARAVATLAIGDAKQPSQLVPF